MHDYLLLDDTSLDKKPEQTSKALDDYFKRLDKGIIEILSDLFDLADQSLFNAFCSSFVRDCVGIIQEWDNSKIFNMRMEQISKFFVLLDVLVLHKGKSWPLDYLVRPLVKDVFPVIRSSVSSIQIISQSSFVWSTHTWSDLVFFPYILPSPSVLMGVI